MATASNEDETEDEDSDEDDDTDDDEEDDEDLDEYEDVSSLEDTDEEDSVEEDFSTTKQVKRNEKMVYITNLYNQLYLCICQFFLTYFISFIDNSKLLGLNLIISIFMYIFF